MKIIFTASALIAFVATANSQFEVPNGNFEVWDLYNTWTLEPQFWETPNNQLIYSTMPDSNAFEGDLAMKIIPLQGFEGAIPQSASVLFSIQEIPASLNFAVKAYVADENPNDQVSVRIQFMYEDAVVLTETWTSFESIDNWEEIEIELSTSQLPFDEAMITVQAGYSDGLGGGNIDTWISIDAMSLEGFLGVDGGSLSPILVYPNPSADMIILSGIDNSNTIESIRIFDASGRDCSSLIEVNKIAAADKIELDVRALASGLYQVVVRTLNPTDHYRIQNIVKQ
jgi:hypothetical protein